MNTNHDDLPHPVPPVAFLRWKENYFFIVLDEKNDVFGMAHFNHEPGFERARMSCNMQVKGKPYRYSNMIPFPEDFEYNPHLGDGRLKLHIVESHKQFKLSLKADDWGFDITFDRRFPTYDYSAATFAAPENYSFREAMTLGTNLHYNHTQQGMSVSGSITAGGETLPVNGYGYRDHSWSMRSDGLVARHTWCGLNFPNMVVGAKTLETTFRPGLIAREGYISDKDGTRALRKVEAHLDGKDKVGLPLKLVHELKDVYGKSFRIESDVGGRLAEVPLDPEKPHAKGHYIIAETFCRSVDTGSGEKGISLIELGGHSTLGGFAALAGMK